MEVDESDSEQLKDDKQSKRKYKNDSDSDVSEPEKPSKTKKTRASKKSLKAKKEEKTAVDSDDSADNSKKKRKSKKSDKKKAANDSSGDEKPAKKPTKKKKTDAKPKKEYDEPKVEESEEEEEEDKGEMTLVYSDTFHVYSEPSSFIGPYSITPLKTYSGYGTYQLHGKNFTAPTSLHHKLHAYFSYPHKTSLWDAKISKQKPNEDSNEDLNREFNVDVYLNIKKFEKYVKTGKLVPRRALVFMIADESIVNNLSSDFLDNYKKECIPLVTHDPHKQPSCMKTMLYKYQLDALTWMKQLEGSVFNKYKWNYSKLVKWDKSSILFDMKKGLFELEDRNTDYVVTHGGVLADEMGLGKTLTTIGLIVANPMKLEHSKSLASDDFDSRFISKATLIFCPSHLTNQWADEISQSLKKKLKVFVITTKINHAKYTYKDFVNADIIIVSYQFITNKNYATLGRAPQPGRYEKRDKVRELELGAYRHDMKRRSDKGLSEACPVFEHFHFHRMVLDEAHEVITKTSYHTIFNLISSSFRWYVSGTPFPNGKTFDATLHYLKCEATSSETNFAAWESLKNTNSSLVIEQFFFKNMFWRNTKKSIGKEFKVPDVCEELILLEHSDVERGLYREAQAAGDQLRLRQLCCHIQTSDKDRGVLGSDKKTLDEVRKLTIENREQEIKFMTNKIEKLTKEKNEVDVQTKEGAKEYAIIVETITDTKRLLAIHNSTLVYFRSLVPQIAQSTNEPCTICMEDISHLTMTPCGHIFCKDCILAAISRQSVCPLCRATVEKDMLTEIVEPSQREELDDKHKIVDMVSKYGTKTAHLIKYLNELREREPDSKVIIFSQWDDMLHRIGASLTENGVVNVFCKGNVHQRNKAIENFKKPDVSVIMLSLANAASGTNLTQANYVILIDPVAGSKGEAEAIESQAIGRAFRQGQKRQLTIVRLIIKNTIEHELYTRNNMLN